MFDDPRLAALLAPTLLVLAGALLARFGRLPGGYARTLGVAALPLGLLLGLVLLLGGLQASPRQLAERLPMLALILLVPGLLAARWPRPWLRWPLLALASLLTGWWMGGGALYGPDLWRALPSMLPVAAAAAATCLALQRRWQGMVLAPGLALLLHAAAPPGPWADLALVPAVVAISAAAGGGSLLPMAGWLALGPLIAGLAVGPVIGLGRPSDWLVVAGLVLTGVVGAVPVAAWAAMAAQLGILLLATMAIWLA